MDINYNPQVKGWLENKRKSKQSNNSIIILIGIFSVLFTIFINLFLNKVELNILNVLGAFICASTFSGFFTLALGWVWAPNTTENISSKPKLKVEFLKTGSMKYWIVLGNKQEELKINGKTVNLLTENEVHEVKQELYRRWLACEQEALQKAYEEGYKSKSKLL